MGIKLDLPYPGGGSLELHVPGAIPVWYPSIPVLLPLYLHSLTSYMMFVWGGQEPPLRLYVLQKNSHVRGRLDLQIRQTHRKV